MNRRSRRPDRFNTAHVVRLPYRSHSLFHSGYADVVTPNALCPFRRTLSSRSPQNKRVATVNIGGRCWTPDVNMAFSTPQSKRVAVVGAGWRCLLPDDNDLYVRCHSLGKHRSCVASYQAIHNTQQSLYRPLRCKLRTVAVSSVWPVAIKASHASVSTTLWMLSRTLPLPITFAITLAAWTWSAPFAMHYTG